MVDRGPQSSLIERLPVNRYRLILPASRKNIFSHCPLPRSDMVSVQFCALCRRRITLVEFCCLALYAPPRADWLFTAAAAAAMPHAHKPNYDLRILTLDACHPTSRKNSPFPGALHCSMHPLCSAFSQLFLFHRLLTSPIVSGALGRHVFCRLWCNSP
jgi:hypothetical protein